MNRQQASDPSWPQTEQYDPMEPLPDDDFAKFLDLENIDLNIPLFESNDGNGHPSHNAQAASSGDGDLAIQHALQLTGDEQLLASQSDPNRYQGNISQAQTTPATIGYSQANQYNQDPALHHGRYNQIPPTPNSAEMHPDAVRYLQQLYLQSGGQQQQQYQLRKDDLAFTPLVSPEVHPNDSPYSFAPEYTVPGAYLSPLTSPALQPQQDGSSTSYARSRTATATSSVAASPIDASSTGPFEDPISSEERPRKTRRKTTAPRSTGPHPQVRQSHTQKARSRKDGSAGVGLKNVNNFFNEAQQRKVTDSQPSPALRTVPNANSFSDLDSTSPASTPDISMAPPPLPKSVTASPALMATMRSNNTQRNSESSDFSPATPASLMRLPQQQKPGSLVGSPGTRNSGYGDIGEGMEDLRLPDAAQPAAYSLARPDARTAKASVNYAGSPTSATSISNNSSIKGTPTTSTIASPTGSVASKKFDSKSGGRGNRKRNSSSTSHISPALRPKISPSIKPLLPEGAISTETHALLLASKSNYQNILDGTHLPGVTYPSDLSTHLTSKRTSHKLAEQGRRNRINTALQEMQNLLPAAITSAHKSDPEVAVESKSPTLVTTPAAPAQNVNSGAIAAQQAAMQAGGNSKAATVEMAIEYIKTLNVQLATKDAENEQLKEEMFAMREKLEERAE